MSVCFESRPFMSLDSDFRRNDVVKQSGRTVDSPSSNDLSGALEQVAD